VGVRTLIDGDVGFTYALVRMQMEGLDLIIDITARNLAMEGHGSDDFL